MSMSGQFWIIRTGRALGKQRRVERTPVEVDVTVTAACTTCRRTLYLNDGADRVCPVCASPVLDIPGGTCDDDSQESAEQTPGGREEHGHEPQGPVTVERDRVEARIRRAAQEPLAGLRTVDQPIRNGAPVEWNS